MSAPVFVAASHASTDFGSSVTVNKPVGLLGGDHLFMVAVWPSATAYGTPTGWTVLREGGIGGTYGGLAVLYHKIAAGTVGQPSTEPASYAPNGNSDQGGAASIAAYRGGSLGASAATFAIATNTDPGKITAPSVAVTGSNAVVARLYVNIWAFSGAISPDPPQTSRGASPQANYPRTAAAEQAQASAGPTGTATASLQKNSGAGAFTVVLDDQSTAASTLTLAGTVPAVQAVATLDVQPPPPALSLAGTVPPVQGSASLTLVVDSDLALTGTLPALAAAVSMNTDVAAVDLSLAGTLPAVEAAVLLDSAHIVAEPDTFNHANGRTRVGVADVAFTPTPTPIPPTLVPSPIHVMAEQVKETP